MAGRPKRGIEYSAWDTDIFENDTKIDTLIDAQGWIGFSIYFYLCQRAYASDGYFYRWGFANAPTTARKMGGGIGSGTVKEVVLTCLRIGLFDDRLFDQSKGVGVLTSRGIQRRYVEAIRKRDVRTVDKEYWLLDPDESRGISFFGGNGDFLSGNGDSLPGNGDSLPGNAPKSKVKKSKVKESKGEECIGAGAPSSPHSLTASQLIEDRHFPQDLEAALKEWVKYHIEIRKPYKETGLKSLLTQAGKKADEYGVEAVVNLISECMSNQYQGIIWDRLDSCKKKDAWSNGRKDLAENRFSVVEQWMKKNSGS